MSKEVDFKEAFSECFKILGLLNADGLTVENKKKMKEIIQTYLQAYRTLRTHKMLENMPNHVKALPNFQKGMINWIKANNLKREEFDF